MKVDDSLDPHELGFCTHASLETKYASMLARNPSAEVPRLLSLARQPFAITLFKRDAYTYKNTSNLAIKIPRTITPKALPDLPKNIGKLLREAKGVGGALSALGFRASPKGAPIPLPHDPETSREIAKRCRMLARAGIVTENAIARERDTVLWMRKGRDAEAVAVSACVTFGNRDRPAVSFVTTQGRTAVVTGGAEEIPGIASYGYHAAICGDSAIDPSFEHVVPTYIDQEWISEVARQILNACGKDPAFAGMVSSASPLEALITGRGIQSRRGVSIPSGGGDGSISIFLGGVKVELDDKSVSRLDSLARSIDLAGYTYKDRSSSYNELPRTTLKRAGVERREVRIEIIAACNSATVRAARAQQMTGPTAESAIASIAKSARRVTRIEL